MKKIDLKKIFKKKKIYKKPSFKISPGIYWRLILFVFVIFILSGAVFSFLLYQQVNDDLMFVSAGTGNRAQVEKNFRAKEVMEFFRSREDQFNQILDLNISVIDPSL